MRFACKKTAWLLRLAAALAVLVLVASATSVGFAGQHTETPQVSAKRALAMAYASAHQAEQPVAAEPAEAAEAEGLPQMDSSRFPGQLFWLFITFSLTYGLMRYVALPAVAGVVDSREQTMRDQVAAAKRNNQEAKRLMAEYEARLQAARQAAQQNFQAAAEAQATKTALALAAQATSLKESVQKATDQIAEQTKKLKDALQGEADQVVSDLVQAISGFHPDGTVVQQAVRAAITQQAI